MNTIQKCFFRRVAPGTTESMDVEIPSTGAVVTCLYLAASHTPDCHVELVYDLGGAGEYIMISCHGTIQVDPSWELDSSCAGKKITMRLINNSSNAETLGIGIRYNDHA